MFQWTLQVTIIVNRSFPDKLWKTFWGILELFLPGIHRPMKLFDICRSDYRDLMVLDLGYLVSMIYDNCHGMILD